VLLKELKGDILLINKGIICHQVNCFGIMGAGIAKQIKEKFPEVFNDYHDFCNRILNQYGSRYELLGMFRISSIYKSGVYNESLHIANIFGQGGIRCKRQETKYDAVNESLNGLKNLLISKGYKSKIFFPKLMGCGLGGGNWDIYYEIIKSHFPDGIIINYEKGKVPFHI